MILDFAESYHQIGRNPVVWVWATEKSVLQKDCGRNMLYV